MTTPYWTGSADSGPDTAWNHCLLGDVDLPGIIEVTVDRETKIDVQNPKGEDGAFTVDEGQNPASVSIEVRLLTEAHLREWEVVYPKIYPKTAGKKRDPKGIYHPECTIKGVDSVIVQKIRGMAPTSQGGKREIIDCIEYLPEPVKPKKKAGKGSQAKPASRPSAFVDPLTGRALDQEFSPKGVEATDFLFQGT